MDVDIFLDHDQAPSELRRAVTGFKSGFGEVRVAGVRSHRVIMPVQSVELRKSGYERTRDEAQWLYFEPRGARQFAAMLMEMADHAEAADGTPSTAEDVRGNLDAPLVVGEFHIATEDYEIEDDQTEPIVHLQLRALEPAVAGVPEPPISDFHFVLPEEVTHALTRRLTQLQSGQPGAAILRGFNIEPHYFADDDGSNQVPALTMQLRSLPIAEIETVAEALSEADDGTLGIEQHFTMLLPAAQRLGDWLLRAVNALEQVSRDSGVGVPEISPTPESIGAFDVRQGYVRSSEIGADGEESEQGELKPVVILGLQAAPLSAVHLDAPHIARVHSFVILREDAARLAQELGGAAGEDDRERFL